MRRGARAISVLFVLMGSVAAISCGSDRGERGCQSDNDCRANRACVDGWCVQATGEDAGREGGGTGSSGGADSIGGTDSDENPVHPIDTEGVPPEDVEPVEVGPWPDVPGVDGYTDVEPPGPDGGRERQLSCHEFATCQWIGCERFDFSCKQQYSARTPTSEIEQLDRRQSCVEEHCSGMQGEDQIECTVENCSQEWAQCAEHPDSGSRLSCSEFHSCVHLCNGRENRQVCHSNCRSNATSRAMNRFQNYTECVASRCEGTEGREHLECIRSHCGAELSDCWGC